MLQTYTNKASGLALGRAHPYSKTSGLSQWDFKTDTTQTVLNTFQTATGVMSQCERANINVPSSNAKETLGRNLIMGRNI